MAKKHRPMSLGETWVMVSLMYVAFVFIALAAVCFGFYLLAKAW